ncbi:MAG: Rha family transcriptional regulator [Magnetococcus sp. MYC-9]
MRVERDGSHGNSPPGVDDGNSLPQNRLPLSKIFLDFHSPPVARLLPELQHLHNERRTTAPDSFGVFLCLPLGATSCCVSAIAEHFDKQHKNVLRDIANLERLGEFYRLNFEPVEYIDAKGERRPAVEVTKDGFMFLVMGFTGEKADAF